MPGRLTHLQIRRNFGIPVILDVGGPAFLEFYLRNSGLGVSFRKMIGHIRKSKKSGRGSREVLE